MHSADGETLLTWNPPTLSLIPDKSSRKFAI
ncbi:hypothetical protein A2U01_0086528, partial [Trifolium medium]|nr:hypothetical protein [Trifolium medium]